MKKKLTLICLVVICLSIAVGGTTAYFTAEGRAHNVITSGFVEVKLVEKTKSGTELVDFPTEGVSGVMPGQSVSKIVSVENKGAEAWIRVKVDKSVKDAAGKPLSSDYISISFNTTDWVKKGDYYYYTKSVPTNKATSVLFEEVRFAPEMNNDYQGCKVSIDVTAQAVQTAHNPIPTGGNVTDIAGWPKS